jgi:hypothetical protein
MTFQEFRENAIYTSRVRDILNDPVFSLAMEVMQESNPAIDPDPSADAIASVRMLSQLVGFNQYPAVLKILATPVQRPVELEADYSAKNNL